ncbi:hypothetical protein ACFL1B_05680 [Nanoarchaeota archaeon]
MRTKGLRTPQLTPLDQYPELHIVARDMFPTTSENIQDNIYQLLTSFLFSPRINLHRFEEFFSNGADWHNHQDAVAAQRLLAQSPFATYRKKPRKRMDSTEALDSILDDIELQARRVDSDFQPDVMFRGKPLTMSDVEQMPPDFDDNKYGLARADFMDALEFVNYLNTEYFPNITLGFVPESSLRTAEGTSMRGVRAANGQERKGLEMAVNTFFTAVFSDRGGGRLFQKCPSYQYLPKDLRSDLTINGQRTAELDYSSFMLNLAYFFAGEQNPFLEDAYRPIIDEMGLQYSDELREAVKLSVINYIITDRPVKTQKIMQRERSSDYEVLLSHNVGVPDVIGAFQKAHPELKKIMGVERVRGKEYEFFEKKIMDLVLRDVSAEGINVIPLFDGVRCPAANSNRVSEIMSNAFSTYTLREIPVRVQH